jgi:hypothetical protein
MDMHTDTHLQLHPPLLLVSALEHGVHGQLAPHFEGLLEEEVQGDLDGVRGLADDGGGEEGQQGGA